MCGQPIIDAETKDFQETMEMLKLVDKKAYGRHYTWTNKHVWSKIDRAICNEDWVLKYGSLIAQLLENNFSDHSPIHIDIQPGGK